MGMCHGLQVLSSSVRPRCYFLNIAHGFLQSELITIEIITDGHSIYCLDNLTWLVCNVIIRLVLILGEVEVILRVVAIRVNVIHGDWAGTGSLYSNIFHDVGSGSESIKVARLVRCCQYLPICTLFELIRLRNVYGLTKVSSRYPALVSNGPIETKFVIVGIKWLNHGSSYLDRSRLFQLIKQHGVDMDDTGSQSQRA